MHAYILHNTLTYSPLMQDMVNILPMKLELLIINALYILNMCRRYHCDHTSQASEFLLATNLYANFVTLIALFATSISIYITNIKLYVFITSPIGSAT